MATPVAIGPMMLSDQNVRCTRGARPYSTACHRATPHMRIALATCPDGNDAPSSWKKNEPGKPGAVRPVPQTAARLKEAAKLGFARAVVPEAVRSDAAESAIALTTVATLADLVSDIAASGRPRGTSRLRQGG